MNRCFARNLQHPTILDALFYEWGRCAVVIGIHAAQQTEHSMLIMELYIQEMATLWHRQRIQALIHLVKEVKNV